MAAEAGDVAEAARVASENRAYLEAAQDWLQEQLILALRYGTTGQVSLELVLARGRVTRLRKRVDEVNDKETPLRDPDD